MHTLHVFMLFLVNGFVSLFNGTLSGLLNEKSIHEVMVQLNPSLWVWEMLYLSQDCLSKSERNNETWDRTRLLRYRSPERLQLHDEDFFCFA